MLIILLLSESCDITHVHVMSILLDVRNDLWLAGHVPIILNIIPIFLDHTYYSKSNASIFGQWLSIAS